MSRIVFTVGHSNHDWDRFLSLVGGAGVEALIDVRSNPWSRLQHFRQSELRRNLAAEGLAYIYLGDRLGGIPKGRKTDYETMAKRESFAAGIAEVLDIAGRCRPALICAEHEPLTCHRFLLVSRGLAGTGQAQLRHILRDGRIEPQAETEQRLLSLWGDGADLFRTRTETLATAYRLQADKLRPAP